MKRVFFFFCLGLLAAGGAIQAQGISAPLFRTTDHNLYISTPNATPENTQNYTFTWNAAASSEELDGDGVPVFRVDAYICEVEDPANPGSYFPYQLTARGRVAHPWLAVVTGSLPDGTSINGILENGSYSHAGESGPNPGYDYSVSHGADRTENGQPLSRTSYSRSRTADVDANPPTLAYVWSETYVVLDGTGWPQSATVDVSKPGSKDYGTISGTLSGFVSNDGGTWMIDNGDGNSGPVHGPQSLILFGEGYSWQGGSTSIVYDDNAGSGPVTGTTTQTDNYSNGDNTGTANISWSSDNNPSTFCSISASDGSAGSVSGTYNSSSGDIQWSPRSSEVLGASQYHLLPPGGTQALLVAWSGAGSDIDHSTGVVTDAYAGGGYTLTLSGHARQVKNGDTQANVTLTGPGVEGTASSSMSYNASQFTVGGATVQTGDPNRGTPALLGSSTTALWVDRSRYDFLHAYEDATGFRLDVYECSAGRVSVSGTPGSGNPYDVWVSDGPHSGTFAGGSFTLIGCTISLVEPPSQPPAAFWAAGQLYVKSSPAEGQPDVEPFGYTPAAGGVLSLSVVFASGAWQVSLNNAAVTTHQGAVAEGSGAVFLLSPMAGVTTASVPAFATEANGALIAVSESTSRPPAVRLPVPDANNGILQFIGTAEDDRAAGVTAAYYAGAGVPRLLKIRAGATGGAAEVLLSDYAAGTHRPGIYHDSRRLFQAAGPQDTKMPMHVYALTSSSQSEVFWHHPVPAGVPPSFLLRGVPWWLHEYTVTTNATTGLTVVNTATYIGPYSDQQMTLGKLDPATGQRPVTLVSPVYHTDGTSTPGVPTQGTLSDVRGSVRFRDGSIAFSGTASGTQQSITHQDDASLHTIRSDVDILGNNLSFGLLHNDASLAGALFHFTDRLESSVRIAGLHSYLSRNNSEWSWLKAPADTSAATPKVMQLDKDHLLKLYPKTGGDGTSSILLNPGGNSIFEGAILIPESGDISMGGFQAGPPPSAP